jgi:phage terminase large subunit
LRGVNNIPKRFFLTCNPGGVGHRWVKRLFIDKDYKTNCANPEENENPNDYKFIPALVEDNPALLVSSPTYLQQLAALPENMRRAHRYGDWDALAGTYFPEFSDATHVISPCPIPEHWQRYRAFDYGLDMFAPLWIAEDEKGRSYVYREYNESNLIVSDAAARLKSNTGVNEAISITFCPPDMWNRQKDTGKTMAEDFMLNGIGLVKADNNRVQGWLQVKEKLADMPDGKPGLLIFDTCKELIENLKSIQADEKNPNDCAKEPHEITHNCDALRYYCISRTLPAELQNGIVQDDEDEDVEDYDSHMTGGAATASYINYGGKR